MAACKFVASSCAHARPPAHPQCLPFESSTLDCRFGLNGRRGARAAAPVPQPAAAAARSRLSMRGSLSYMAVGILGELGSNPARHTGCKLAIPPAGQARAGAPSRPSSSRGLAMGQAAFQQSNAQNMDLNVVESKLRNSCIETAMADEAEDPAIGNTDVADAKERLKNQYVEMYDADGDGKVTDEEIAAGSADAAKAKARLKENYIDMYDTDGDGKVTDKEIAAVDKQKPLDDSAITSSLSVEFEELKRFQTKTLAKQSKRAKQQEDKTHIKSISHSQFVAEQAKKAEQEKEDAKLLQELDVTIKTV